MPSLYEHAGGREALHHLEASLAIAYRFGFHIQLIWSHYRLALLFLDERQIDDARAHVDQARPYASNEPFSLGCLMALQAFIRYKQSDFEEAKRDALRAVEIFEPSGTPVFYQNLSRNVLWSIEEAMKKHKGRKRLYRFRFGRTGWFSGLDVGYHTY